MRGEREGSPLAVTFFFQRAEQSPDPPPPPPYGDPGGRESDAQRVTSGGRRLRGLPARRVIRAFEKAGYSIARIRGSHYVLECPGRKAVVIPNHNPVRPGLLFARLKDAGLTPEQFEELL